LESFGDAKKVAPEGLQL